MKHHKDQQKVLPPDSPASKDKENAIGMLRGGISSFYQDSISNAKPDDWSTQSKKLKTLVAKLKFGMLNYYLMNTLIFDEHVL